MASSKPHKGGVVAGRGGGIRVSEGVWAEVAGQRQTRVMIVCSPS